MARIHEIRAERVFELTMELSEDDLPAEELRELQIQSHHALRIARELSQGLITRAQIREALEALGAVRRLSMDSNARPVQLLRTRIVDAEASLADLQRAI